MTWPVITTACESAATTVQPRPDAQCGFGLVLCDLADAGPAWKNPTVANTAAATVVDRMLAPPFRLGTHRTVAEAASFGKPARSGLPPRRPPSRARVLLLPAPVRRVPLRAECSHVPRLDHVALLARSGNPLTLGFIGQSLAVGAIASPRLRSSAWCHRTRGITKSGAGMLQRARS